MFKIEIAGYDFESKAGLKRYLNNHRNSLRVGKRLQDEKAAKILHALYMCRPHKVGELKGCVITGWTVEAAGRNTCFAAVLDDGRQIHFSFIKAMKVYFGGGQNE